MLMKCDVGVYRDLPTTAEMNCCTELMQCNGVVQLRVGSVFKKSRKFDSVSSHKQVSVSRQKTLHKLYTLLFIQFSDIQAVVSECLSVYMYILSLTHYDIHILCQGCM